MLASAAALCDPDAIVLGGGVSELGDLLFVPTRRAFAAEALPRVRDIPLLAAGLGPAATVVGAGLAALDARRP